MRKAEPQHSQAQNQPAQRQGGSAALESPQGEQLAQLEAVADASPQAGRLAQLVAMANNSPRMAAQRKAISAIHDSPNVTALRQQISRGVTQAPSTAPSVTTTFSSSTMQMTKPRSRGIPFTLLPATTSAASISSVAGTNQSSSKIVVATPTGVGVAQQSIICTFDEFKSAMTQFPTGVSVTEFGNLQKSSVYNTKDYGPGASMTFTSVTLSNNKRYVYSGEIHFHFLPGVDLKQRSEGKKDNDIPNLLSDCEAKIDWSACTIQKPNAKSSADKMKSGTWANSVHRYLSHKVKAEVFYV